MTQRAASLSSQVVLNSPVFPNSPRRFVLDVRHKATEADSLAQDTCIGLKAQPKSLPPKHFYDAHGSELFELICDTPEYYPTRTEQSLLESYAGAIIDQTQPACIVEFGSGSERKISTVLSAVEHGVGRCTYVPFDVSRSIIEQSSHHLLERFPWLSVRAIVGDYDKHLGALPRLGRTLFMFLGGTIGNFEPSEAADFLRTLAHHMQPEDYLLLGTDLVKDDEVLNRAYNDSQGITAEFNKNVLRVINRRLGGAFKLDAFGHIAFFDRAKSQVEMHLESSIRQTVRIAELEMEIEFAEGERILTEISRKFTQTGVRRMLGGAGLELNSWFEPPNGYFGLSLAKPG